MNPPNAEVAVDIAEQLLAASNSLMQHYKASDPEGRTFSIGVTMFFGIFLSAIASEDDRRIACDAALGYALIPERVLDRMGRHNKN